MKTDEEELLLKEHARIIERQARRAWRMHGIDLDDVRQHARIAALAAIRSYDERRGLSLAVWIHWKTNRALVSLSRSTTRWRDETTTCEPIDIGAHDEEFGRAEMHLVMRSLMEELPKVQKLLAQLIFQSGMSIREAGAWMGLSESQALATYRRIVRYLDREWRVSDLLPSHLA